MYLFSYPHPHDRIALERYFTDRYGMTFTEKNFFAYVDTEMCVVLTTDEWRDLRRAVARVDAVMRRAHGIYLQHLADLLPCDILPYAEFFYEKISRSRYLLGRYDILIDTDDRYRFLELNANTPGLIVETEHLSRLWRPHGYRNPASGFARYTKRWFAKHTDTGGTLGILLAHGFVDEDYLVALAYREMLAPLYGDRIVIGDIYDAHIVHDSILTLAGQRVDTVLSYFPVEFFLSDPEFARTCFELVRSGSIRLINPLASLLFQDKLLYAIAWEHIDEFPPTDRETIREYLPFTTRIPPESATIYLAKPRLGRYGRGILRESFASHIGDEREYIYQQIAKPLPCDDHGNSLVLGVYTDLHGDYTAPIARRYPRGEHTDESSHVMCVYVR